MEGREHREAFFGGRPAKRQPSARRRSVGSTSASGWGGAARGSARDGQSFVSCRASSVRATSAKADGGARRLAASPATGDARASGDSTSSSSPSKSVFGLQARTSRSIGGVRLAAPQRRETRDWVLEKREFSNTTLSLLSDLFTVQRTPGASPNVLQLDVLSRLVEARSVLFAAESVAACWS